MNKKCREVAFFCREVDIKQKKELPKRYVKAVLSYYSSKIIVEVNLPPVAEKRQEPLYFSVVEIML